MSRGAYRRLRRADTASLMTPVRWFDRKSNNVSAVAEYTSAEISPDSEFPAKARFLGAQGDAGKYTLLTLDTQKSGPRQSIDVLTYCSEGAARTGPISEFPLRLSEVSPAIDDISVAMVPTRLFATSDTFLTTSRAWLRQISTLRQMWTMATHIGYGVRGTVQKKPENLLNIGSRRITADAIPRAGTVTEA